MLTCVRAILVLAGLSLAAAYGWVLSFALWAGRHFPPAPPPPAQPSAVQQRPAAHDPGAVARLPR